MFLQNGFAHQLVYRGRKAADGKSKRLRPSANMSKSKPVIPVSDEDCMPKARSPSRRSEKNYVSEEQLALNKETSISIDPSVCVIAEPDDESSVCYGYKISYSKCFVFCLLVLLSGGFVYLIGYWKPEWKLYLTHSMSLLKAATKVLIKDQYNTLSVTDIKELGCIVDDSLLDVMTEELSIAQDDDLDDDEMPPVSPVSINSSERDPLLQESQYLEPMKLRFFYYKCLKYIWQDEKQLFKLLTGLDSEVKFTDAHAMKDGLSHYEEKRRQVIYEKNSIDVKVKSYGRLFFEEAADPFYVFQAFSCALWFSDNYYYYAAAIIFISLLSIMISIYQTRNHLVTLRNMIFKSSSVSVLRPNGNEQEVSSESLVPGDVVVIPSNGCVLHCDAVLLCGNAIVNESMLTGESMPVTKTPIPNPPKNHPEIDEPVDLIKHKRHVLFCGTHVVQTRYYGNAHVLALVLRTGFYTAKGNLIRSILFPKPVDFKFFSDAMKFIGVLCFFAAAGFIYTCYVFISEGADKKEIAMRALDVITIAVPPALPAAMSVGTVYALQRLKKKNIFCISPSRISISGKVKLLCFDKTGTLTEEGLDLSGIILGDKNANSLSELIEDPAMLPKGTMLIAMATCHSLTIIDGKLCGDPLDLKMFEATGWELEEPGTKETERFESIAPTIVRPRDSDIISVKSLIEGDFPLEVGILKQFTFTSDLQRMSVLIRELGAPNMDLYVKGSPEVIANLCLPHTIPKDFEHILSNYARRGYRVLAVAFKPLAKDVQWHHAQNLLREQLESYLTFTGLLIFKNMLKPQTMPVIRKLHNATIRVVMITGDNLLTAVSVARECSMIHQDERLICVQASEVRESSEGPQVTFFLTGDFDEDTESTSNTLIHDRNSFLQRNYHFAMNGKTFGIIRAHLPQLHQRLLVCGTVFARMLPHQKTQLVEDLQKLGYGVGMCGDGANDCGALKMAHAGISLSEAEASVASPFTSKIPNIECVLKVIKEGRCALVTSFSVFKYMALYSMVQYMSVLMLYSVQSNLGDFQYLYIDLGLITAFAVTMSRTGPYPHLVKRRPLGSLVHPVVLFSLISQIFIQLSFQIGVFFYIKTMPYFKPTSWFRARRHHHSDQETQITCYENTVLFCFSSFQYILLAVTFSIGRPYRDALYKNIAFVCATVVLAGCSVVITYNPSSFLHKPLQLVTFHDRVFLLTLLGLAACNALISYLVEFYIVPSLWLRKILNCIRRKRSARNKYKHVLAEIHNDPTWPPSLTPVLDR